MEYKLGDTITGLVLQKDGHKAETTVTLGNDFQVWWYNTNYPGFTVEPKKEAT